MKKKLITFFFIVLLCGCRPKNNGGDETRFSVEKFSLDEREWLTKFLEDFFLESPAIYTLFGTKPMSGITIDTSTEIEFVQNRKTELDQLSSERRGKALRQIGKYYQNNDLYQNWNRWIEWKKKYPNSGFLFRIQPTSSETLYNIDVINIQEVVSTLFSHYQIFSKTIGMDFDPFEVVYDFEKSDSVFWKRVFQSHLLQGILYGFGKRNAMFFSKQMEYEDQGIPHSFISSTSECNVKEEIKLPGFRSYSSPGIQDPVVEKFQQEREVILQRLKGKNFVDEALKRLISN